MSISHHHHPALARWPLTDALSVGAALTTAITVTVTLLHATSASPLRAHAGQVPVKARPASSASARASQEGGAGQADRSVRNPDLPGLQWVTVQGFRVPASAHAGPRVTSSGLAHGFADTPAGAVLAAANIVTRTAWECGPGVFGPTVEKQVTGAGAMALLQNDVAGWQQNASRLPGLVYPQLTAYAVDSYTPGDAMLSIIIGAAGSGGASMYSVTPVKVRWTDGDWPVVAPPGGTWPGFYVPSPAGYTPFAGLPRK